MKFLDRFRISENAGEDANAFAANLGITAGTYENGLVTVSGISLAVDALAGWRWLLGSDAVALATTATGDVFFWSDRQSAVYFLEPQLGQSTFVDKDVRYFFDEFLTKEGVREKVLHEQLVTSLGQRLGPLPYGHCFIAEPWIMLGGTGAEDSYVSGDAVTYLHLVGQAVQQRMEALRCDTR